MGKGAFRDGPSKYVSSVTELTYDRTHTELTMRLYAVQEQHKAAWIRHYLTRTSSSGIQVPDIPDLDGSLEERIPASSFPLS